MNRGNQPPRTPKFVFSAPVSLVPPNDHVLEARVVAWEETPAGFVYDVKHSSGLLRKVPEDHLRERPAKVEKLYRGRVTDGGAPIVTVKEGDQIRVLRDENGDEHNFNWGYGGEGPSILARALLRDMLGVDTVSSVTASRLKSALVSQLPMNEPWTLLERHLRAEIEAASA